MTDRHSIDDQLRRVLDAAVDEKDSPRVVAAVMKSIESRSPSQMVNERVVRSFRAACLAAAAVLIVLVVWASRLSSERVVPQNEGMSPSPSPMAQADLQEVDSVFESYFRDPLGGADVTFASAMDTLLLGDLIR